MYNYQLKIILVKICGRQILLCFLRFEPLCYLRPLEARELDEAIRAVDDRTTMSLGIAEHEVAVCNYKQGLMKVSV